ncbi:MAG: M16 family metallopeptidase, partial [Thermodesulfobacteriota bacterium]
VVERMEHLRSVTMGVWYDVGARDETVGERGISHFLEHMHFKGTATRTAQDIADQIDGVGGELNAFTSREGTTFYAKVLDTEWKLGVELLHDILTQSTLAEQEIEKEKQIILEEIKMIEDTPDEHVHDLFNEAAWGTLGLGQTILGAPEDIRAITRDRLTDYIAHHYRPESTVIGAAGHVDPEELAAVMNQGMGSRGASGGGGPRALQGWDGPGFHIRTKDLAEVHLCVGVRGISYLDEDRYTLSVLNTVLGSGVSSRLFQEIREKRALAYSVYSFVSSYRDSGLFAAYAGTSPEHTGEVVQLILREFGRLRQGIELEVLERAKAQLKGNLILGLESSNSRMSQLARNEMYYRRRYTLEDLIAEIDAVTVGDVQRIVDRLIRQDAIVFTALGPIDEGTLGQDELTLEC